MSNPPTNSPAPDAPPQQPSPAKNTEATAPKKRGKVLIFKYPPGAKSLIGGGFSYLYTHPDRPGLVCKVPSPSDIGEEAMAIEKRIYQRLGTDHPNIVKVVDVDEYGI